MAAGVDFLGKLGQAVQSQQQSGKKDGAPLDNLIARNEQTGAPEMHIPLPDADTAQKIGGLLAGLGSVLQSLGEKKS